MNCTALNRTVQEEVETQYGKQNTDNRLICLLIHPRWFPGVILKEKN